MFSFPYYPLTFPNGIGRNSSYVVYYEALTATHHRTPVHQFRAKVFGEKKLCADFHKTYNHDRSAFPAKEIVSFGTIGGAKALNMEQKVGSLEIGKQADFVLVETDSVNMFPLYDPYSALVYSANSKNVESVYIAGKCLVKENKLVEVSLAELKKNVYQLLMQKEDSLFRNEMLVKEII